jgi:hypothetical protein
VGLISGWKLLISSGTQDIDPSALLFMRDQRLMHGEDNYGLTSSGRAIWYPDARPATASYLPHSVTQ